MGRLVLGRRTGQEIAISGPGMPDGVTVRVASIEGDTVRLAIEAPREIDIMRTELLDPALTTARHAGAGIPALGGG